MGPKPKDSLHPPVTTAQLPCWSPVISSKAGLPFHGHIISTPSFCSQPERGAGHLLSCWTLDWLMAA